MEGGGRKRRGEGRRGGHLPDLWLCMVTVTVVAVGGASLGPWAFLPLLPSQELAHPLRVGRGDPDWQSPVCPPSCARERVHRGVPGFPGPGGSPGSFLRV